MFVVSISAYALVL